LSLIAEDSVTTFLKTGVNTIKKIRELVEGLQVATLSVVMADRKVRMRPLPLPDCKFDGNFWIFLEKPSPFLEPILSGESFSLHFSSEADDRYLTVTGTATVEGDKRQRDRLWNPGISHWFADGPRGSDLVLLKLKVESAEYWDVNLHETVALDCTGDWLHARSEKPVGPSSRPSRPSQTSQIKAPNSEIVA
jgi:general stress protein 26